MPRPDRRDNNYREYDDAEVEHLRLLIDLRRMDLPLESAAQMAGWCHAGHCADTTIALPQVIAARRLDVATRMAGLRELDERLANLESHLSDQPVELTVLASGGPCCDAAASVMGVAEGGCACCATGRVDG